MQNAKYLCNFIISWIFFVDKKFYQLFCKIFFTSSNQINKSLINLPANTTTKQAGAKKNSLVSGNRQGEKIFITRPPTRIIECVSEYIFLISKKKKKRKEKGISVENLTGYDDIVCDFAMCAFNLLDRVLNFSWLLIWI